MKYYVYALVRPDAFRPFYIGATCVPRQRASVHRGTHGHDILFSIVGEFDKWQEAGRVETETIEFYRLRGVALLNSPLAGSYSPVRGSDYDAAWEEAIRQGMPRPDFHRLRRPPPRPYRWKPLRPISEVCDTMAQLSEKLSQLAPSEVVRVIG